MPGLHLGQETSREHQKYLPEILSPFMVAGLSKIVDSRSVGKIINGQPRWATKGIRIACRPHCTESYT
jgi:hypothetical protein